jgi:hypothetical protein
MSEEKPTFTDPQTGEEIESTPLARWGTGLAVGLIAGLFLGLLATLDRLRYGWAWGVSGGLFLWLLSGLLLKRAAREKEWGRRWGIMSGLGLLFGLFLGWSKVYRHGWVVGLAAGLLSALFYGLLGPLTRRTHDDIVRWQHLRRQRILKRKMLEEEWAGVPDRALSRAVSPKEPKPTEASLSQAERPAEAKGRLASAVEEGTAEQEATQKEVNIQNY